MASRPKRAAVELDSVHRRVIAAAHGWLDLLAQAAHVLAVRTEPGIAPHAMRPRVGKPRSPARGECGGASSPAGPHGSLTWRDKSAPRAVVVSASLSTRLSSRMMKTGGPHDGDGQRHECRD